MKSMSRWIVFDDTSNSSASLRQLGNLPALIFSCRRIIRSSGGREWKTFLRVARGRTADVGRRMCDRLLAEPAAGKRNFLGEDVFTVSSG
jgi:hypothetical protein